MIALAATAVRIAGFLLFPTDIYFAQVHAALLHIKHGANRSAKPDFNSAYFAGIYLSHMNLLNAIQEKSQQKYHALLYHIYCEV